MKTTRVAAIAAAALVTLLAAVPAKADTPPTPPGNLHAASITDTDIVLAWSASTDDSGAVNYAVFFDDNPTPFLTSADTTFDVSLNRAIGMIPGSTHSFQVRAEDPSGNHSFSNTLTTSFAPGDNTPPTAPQNLRVVSDTAAGIELAWDPSTDASSFDYRVSGAPCGGGAVTVTHVLVPSISSDPVCGIGPGGTYTFAVTALDEFLNASVPSNRVTVMFTGG
jgi:chitodextrinase